jgi:hypothetical protein
LHTNFKLSGSGEFLGLNDASGKAMIVFDPEFPAQQTDIAYAFDGNSYVFTSIPTPGAQNVFPVKRVLPAPHFSIQHGFYDAPFHVAITSDSPSVKIYYTTDGSAANDTVGTLYHTPISISTTTVLRAIAMRLGSQPSTVTTATYLFLKDVVNQPNNPQGILQNGDHTPTFRIQQ